MLDCLCQLAMIFACPRPYAHGLYRKMTKAAREKLKNRLIKKGIQLVKVYKDQKGKKRVSMPQRTIDTFMFPQIASYSISFIYPNISMVRANLATKLRQGTRALKTTQVYPRGYGKQVANLHLSHIAAWMPH